MIAQRMRRAKVGTTARITATVVREDPAPGMLDTPALAARYWREVIAVQPDYEPEKESVCVVMLTTRLRPFAWNRVSLGTVNGADAAPREVFRPVILAGAYGFFLMHNHPSGDIEPSRPDLAMTLTIMESAKILGLAFMDHVIVPSGVQDPERAKRYFSFREKGVIK